MKQLIKDIKMAWYTAMWCRNHPGIDRSFLSLLWEELVWLVKTTMSKH